MRFNCAFLLIGVFTFWYIGYNINELVGPIGTTGYIIFLILVVVGVQNASKVAARRTGNSRGRAADPKADVSSRIARRPKTVPVLTANKETVLDIETALDRLPATLLSRSGSVFYTGRDAFTAQRPLYLLGLNPGGDPLRQADNTVQKHIDGFRTRIKPWSAYADDSWEGAKPGTWGMQPRVLHMLGKLGYDPRLTPASNVVFVRTRDEAALTAESSRLIRECWPVHQTVIETLGVRIIVCFGGTAGAWVRQRLSAIELVDEFIEQNARGWKSTAYRARDGRVVVTVTHPGRADWRNPKSDPTPLVRRALAL